MVMWDLWEKMVNHVSADVMVDVVEPPVVPVKRCQASTQIAPFLVHIEKCHNIDSISVISYRRNNLWSVKSVTIMNTKYLAIWKWYSPREITEKGAFFTRKRFTFIGYHTQKGWTVKANLHCGCGPQFVISVVHVPWFSKCHGRLKEVACDMWCWTSQ